MLNRVLDALRGSDALIRASRDSDRQGGWRILRLSICGLRRKGGAAFFFVLPPVAVASGNPFKRILNLSVLSTSCCASTRKNPLPPAPKQSLRPVVLAYPAPYP